MDFPFEPIATWLGTIATVVIPYQLWRWSQRARRAADLEKALELRASWFSWSAEFKLQKEGQVGCYDFDGWILVKKPGTRMTWLEKRECRLLAKPVVVVEGGKGFRFDMEDALLPLLQNNRKLPPYFDLRRHPPKTSSPDQLGGVPPVEEPTNSPPPKVGPQSPLNIDPQSVVFDGDHLAVAVKVGGGTPPYTVNMKIPVDSVLDFIEVARRQGKLASAVAKKLQDMNTHDPRNTQEHA